ncbi:MAG: PAS domain S-box protein [Ignavibacteriales bacterium]
MLNNQTRSNSDWVIAFFKHHPIAMFIIRLKDRKILDVNDRCCSMTGYSREELLGKTGTEFFSTLKWQSQLMPFMTEEASALDLSMDFMTKSGEQRIGQFSISLITLEGELCLSGAFQDVTNQRNNEERFWKAFHLSPIAMAIARASDSTCIEINKLALELSGYTREEIIGRNPIDLDLYTDPELRQQLLKLVHNGEPIRNVEAPFTVKSGQSYVSIFSVEPITLGGEPCLLGTFQDITLRKRLENALRASEERFFKAFHNSPIAMSIVRESDDVYLDVNEKWSAVCGYDREDAIGRTSKEMNLFPKALNSREVSRRLSKGGEIYNLEVEIRSKSGDIRAVSLSAEQIILDGEPCRLNASQDITESKRMEQNLARLDRLNLVGEVAASMGHEIRNPITTVRGFMQLMQEKPDLSQYSEVFDLLIDELDRCNNIISEFLLLAKNRAVELKIQSLNNAITTMLPLIQADATSHDMSINLSLSDIPDLAIDQQDIRQLILNLTRNGLEAMQPGGIMTISTEAFTDQVILSIQDQGCGIPQELIDNLGTPFITTKENGVGLGLAVCYSVAVRHHASISCDSGPNGTVFKIHFRIP